MREWWGRELGSDPWECVIYFVIKSYFVIYQRKSKSAVNCKASESIF